MYPAPFGPGNTRSTLGIYDHPSSLPYVESTPIGDSWAARVGQFATSYTVKTAIWARGLGLTPP